MDNNVISFEQMQKFLDEIGTWFVNPINMEAIQENILNNLRPKMHWKETFQPGVKYRYVCSNCGNDEMYKTPFCPQCGAMRRDLE